MEIGIDIKKRAALAFEKSGIKQTTLAKQIGVGQSTLWNFLFGATENFGKLREFAVAVGIPLEWLLTGEGSSESQQTPEPSEVIRSTASATFGPDTVPILGQCNGSSDAIDFHNGVEIGRTLRHPRQQGVKDAFALHTCGNSMEPRYRSGELVFVAGRTPPLAGQDCVVEMHDGTGFLKEFAKTTDKEVICRQLNPAREWKRPLSEVKAVHAVVGRG